MIVRLNHDLPRHGYRIEGELAVNGEIDLPTIEHVLKSRRHCYRQMVQLDADKLHGPTVEIELRQYLPTRVVATARLRPLHVPVGADDGDWTRPYSRRLGCF